MWDTCFRISARCCGIDALSDCPRPVGGQRAMMERRRLGYEGCFFGGGLKRDAQRKPTAFRYFIFLGGPIPSVGQTLQGMCHIRKLPAWASCVPLLVSLPNLKTLALHLLIEPVGQPVRLSHVRQVTGNCLLDSTNSNDQAMNIYIYIYQ